LLALGTASFVVAQTFPANTLAFKSSGSGAGDWTLSEKATSAPTSRLRAARAVTVGVDASGATTDAVDPHMNIVIADTKAVSTRRRTNNYQHTFDLPAGHTFPHRIQQRLLRPIDNPRSVP